ncbi:MAG TPA: autotransporter domain-containing protein [Thermoanaerobaculia bacterium]|nr:autotransporter domain-containing protein [Thermoanaerobaculia bacterium]
MKRILVAAALLILGLTANAQTSQGPEGNEGPRPLTMRYQIPFPVMQTITGDYQTVDGTATAADNDYVPKEGKFTIEAGQTQSTEVSVQIVGDRKIEADESFTIVASNVAGGVPPPPITLTLVNDDVPAVSVANAQVTEGNAGTTVMTFPITLTTPAAIAVQATYFTSDGTATGGVDYQPVQEGTVTFEPGITLQTVNVNVIRDTNFESDETLTLTVTPTGGTAATATGTITNDDTQPASQVTIVSGNNQQGRLGHALAQPLVVQVLGANGAPVAGVVVQWSVTSGDALLDPATSTTGVDGRASTNVTLRSVGPIEVRATAANLPPVTFSINAKTSFADRAQGPVAVPIARVLDRVCARNQEPLADACRTLSLLSDGDLTPTLERVAPQQSGAQSKVAGEVVSAVATGVGARLSALRGGVDRLSIQQLALNINGQSIPLGTIAHALFPQDAQTDAGGAEESDYNGWSAFLSGNLGDGERIARDGQLGFDLESRGLMFGVDRMFGESIFGASLNLMQLDTKLSSDTGSLDTSGYALSLYASRGGFFASSSPNASFDGVHLDGSVTLGRNKYEAEHTVEAGGFTLIDATSENDANVFAVSGGTGFEAHRGRTDFDLSLSGTWSRASIDDLTEQGDGPLLLFVEGHEIESLVGTVGLNVRSAFNVPFGTLLPSFRAEMVHEFEDDARLVTARFLRAADSSFTIPLDRPDANYGRLGVGLQGVFPYGWSASIEAMQDVLRSDLHFRTVQFTLYKSF